MRTPRPKPDKKREPGQQRVIRVLKARETDAAAEAEVKAAAAAEANAAAAVGDAGGDATGLGELAALVGEGEDSELRMLHCPGEEMPFIDDAVAPPNCSLMDFIEDAHSKPRAVPKAAPQPKKKPRRTSAGELAAGSLLEASFSRADELERTGVLPMVADAAPEGVQPMIEQKDSAANSEAVVASGDEAVAVVAAASGAEAGIPREDMELIECMNQILRVQICSLRHTVLARVDVSLHALMESVRSAALQVASSPAYAIYCGNQRAFWIHDLTLLWLGLVNLGLPYVPGDLVRWVHARALPFFNVVQDLPEPFRELFLNSAFFRMSQKRNPRAFGRYLPCFIDPDVSKSTLYREERPWEPCIVPDTTQMEVCAAELVKHGVTVRPSLNCEGLVVRLVGELGLPDVKAEAVKVLQMMQAPSAADFVPKETLIARKRLPWFHIFQPFFHHDHPYVAVAACVVLGCKLVNRKATERWAVAHWKALRGLRQDLVEDGYVRANRYNHLTPDLFTRVYHNSLGNLDFYANERAAVKGVRKRARTADGGGKPISKEQELKAGYRFLTTPVERPLMSSAQWALLTSDEKRDVLRTFAQLFAPAPGIPPPLVPPIWGERRAKRAKYWGTAAGADIGGMFSAMHESIPVKVEKHTWLPQWYVATVTAVALFLDVAESLVHNAVCAAEAFMEQELQIVPQCDTALRPPRHKKFGPRQRAGRKKKKKAGEDIE